jgi:hypothetical protein
MNITYQLIADGGRRDTTANVFWCRIRVRVLFNMWVVTVDVNPHKVSHMRFGIRR